MTDVSETRPKSRWLGLRSYEETDAGMFFGREKASEKLFRMVKREPLTVVFAPSGTGKTSLLRAGLFPKLRESGFLPIWIRLDHSSAEVDHIGWLRSELERVAVEENLEIASVVPPQVEPDRETFWEYIHRVELWNENNELVIPVFVLDQFEEMFTLGHGRPETASFLEMLADVVEKRIPVTLRERLRRDGTKQSIPIKTQGFRFVVSLRQDFVAQLDGLRKRMPQVMRQRFPLHQLTGTEALEAVLGPGEGIVSEAVARQIVWIVAGESGTPEDSNVDLSTLSVEPNHLSLVCKELDQQRLDDGESQITADGLDEQSRNILRRFYDSSFDGLPPEARKCVEDSLLTATGFRKSQPLDDATASGLTPESLDRLVDRHVLRFEDRRDIRHVELTHDLLTSVVKESRDRRHVDEERVRLRMARRRERKRRRRYATACAVLLAFLAVSIMLTFRASRAEKIAERSRDETEQLISFMTNDLYDRLLPIGRLDLLHDVASKAENHFAEISTHDLDSDTRISQASALKKIANVLAMRGFVSDALATHQRAIVLLQEGLDDGTCTDIELAETELAELQVDFARVLNDWGDADKAIDSCASALNLIDKHSGFLAESGSSTQQTLDVRVHLEMARARITVGELKLAEGALTHCLNHLEASHGFSDVKHGQRSASRYVAETLADSATLTSPHNVELLALVWNEWANLFHARQTFPRAFFYRRSALVAISNLSNSTPGNSHWLLEKGRLLLDLADLHLAIGDAAGARDKLEIAMAIAMGKVETEISLRSDTPSSNGGVSGNQQWQELRIAALQFFGRAAFQEFELQLAESQSLPVEREWRTFFDRALEAAAALPQNTGSDWLRVELMREYGELLLHDGTLCESMSTIRDGNGFEDAISILERARKKCDASLMRLHGENPTVLLTHADLLMKLALAREKSLKLEQIPKEFHDASVNLDKAQKLSPGFARLLDHRSELQRARAEAHRKRGQTTKAIGLLESALRTRQQAHEVDRTVAHRIRAYGESALELGDLVDWSEHSETSTNLALQYFDQCCDILESLSDDQRHVADRLRIAETRFRMARLYLDLDRPEEARSYLELSSKLGWAPATELLLESDLTKTEAPHHAVRLASLATRQEVKVLRLPCVFTDELFNDTIESIQRQVLIDVVITGPAPGVAPDDSTLQQELDRLESEYSVKLAAGVRDKLHDWYEDLQQSTNAKLSLAQLADLGFSGVLNRIDTRDATIDSSLRLLSPVTGTYQDPEQTPTVVGRECVFHWDYKGTERDLRRFQLDVAYEEPNLETQDEEDSIRIPLFTKEVRGTSYRHIFGADDDGLNRTLSWRVRAISETNQIEAKDGDADLMWSNTHRVGVYDSLLSRIKATKVLRVGFSEFDRDLIDWDPTKAEPIGFDGEVIKFIKRSLSKKLFDNDDSQLETKPYRYSWVGMFEAVSRCDVDIAVSVITRTKDREERYQIRFTEPYYETPLSIVSRKNDKIATNADCLKSDLRIIANEGVRGAQVGKLIFGDRLDTLSYPNIDSLLEHILADESDGCITDFAPVAQFLAHQPEKGEQLHVFALSNPKDYMTLLADKSVDTNAMMLDYGGLAYEQYAVATSVKSVRLREEVNKAVLEFRRTIADKVAEDADLPKCVRLNGPNQQTEDALRKPTVVSQRPNQRTSTDIVIGPEINFSWFPMESTEHFRFQLSTSPDFTADTVLCDVHTREPSYSLATTDQSEIQGELYWRAKATDSSELDVFPRFGWCPPVRFEHYNNCLDRIRDKKTIRIAIDITNGYAAFLDRDRKLRGFDVELIKALRDKLATKLQMESLDIQFVQMSFGGLFESVQSFQVDAGLGGKTVTKEREEKFDLRFTTPYCRTRQAAIWHRRINVDSSADLVGKRFIATAFNRGYTLASALTEEDKLVVTKQSSKPYLLERLLAGEADITLMDYPTAFKMVEEHAEKDQFGMRPVSAAELPFKLKVEVSDPYGIAIQKDQTRLLELVDESIKELRDSPEKTLEEIFSHYQGSAMDKPIELEW